MCFRMYNASLYSVNSDNSVETLLLLHVGNDEESIVASVIQADQ